MVRALTSRMPSIISMGLLLWQDGLVSRPRSIRVLTRPTACVPSWAGSRRARQQQPRPTSIYWSASNILLGESRSTLSRCTVSFHPWDRPTCAMAADPAGSWLLPAASRRSMYLHGRGCRCSGIKACPCPQPAAPPTRPAPRAPRTAETRPPTLPPRIQEGPTKVA